MNWRFQDNVWRFKKKRTSPMIKWIKLTFYYSENGKIGLIKPTERPTKPLKQFLFSNWASMNSVKKFWPPQPLSREIMLLVVTIMYYRHKILGSLLQRPWHHSSIRVKCKMRCKKNSFNFGVFFLLTINS